MEQFLAELPESVPTIRLDADATAVPIDETLERLFKEQPVSVTDAPPKQDSDVVVVRDEEVVASSSIETLLRSVFLINSDVFITGSRGLGEIELPAVLKALEETPFQLRGYPDSDTEKLLFVIVSRRIEQLAYEIGEGDLHVGFQRLSRLTDEPGTYRVYNQLCETNLDIHAYGVEDVSPPSELSLTAHSGTSQLYRQCWFVVFSPSSATHQAAGLVAIQRESNRWDGFWTFQPQRVSTMKRLVTMPASHN